MSDTSGSMRTTLKNRLYSFLIWQSIPCSVIFISLVSFSQPYFFRSFLLFSSHFLFSAALSFIASPHPRPRLPSSILFLVSTASSAAISLSVVAPSSHYGILLLGFRGFLVGSLFALHYVLKRQWVLRFPIIQRPSFFGFKLGIPCAARRAFMRSTFAFVCSGICLEFVLPRHSNYSIATRRFFSEQIHFFAATFAIFLSWELTHRLHWVLHTKRAIFAPPEGSAAAKTNPSEHLLSALKESNPTSLIRYLAYLDLCMVCEKNVDTWRRAGFFEESGETYQRVIAVCLRPLEQLATKLNNAHKVTQILDLLDVRPDLKYVEELFKYNFQVYAWCSRTVASLTTRSRKEDKFGVARRSGSNVAVVSTLLSCFLAVENFMGKKTNLQSPNQLLGHAGINRATADSGRVDVAAGRRSGPVNSKAYAVADVLKTSIYEIVGAFHDEMLAGGEAGLLETDWVTNWRPPFGTREMLIDKLLRFLCYEVD